MGSSLPLGYPQGPPWARMLLLLLIYLVFAIRPLLLDGARPLIFTSFILLVSLIIVCLICFAFMDAVTTAPLEMPCASKF